MESEVSWFAEQTEQHGSLFYGISDAVVHVDLWLLLSQTTLKVTAYKFEL